jgi:hypothetical protein
MSFRSVHAARFAARSAIVADSIGWHWMMGKFSKITARECIAAQREPTSAGLASSSYQAFTLWSSA